MMLFTNQLHKLELENKDSFQSVQNGDSRREIVNMMKYLSASSLSLYQIQIIRKDLIGMAIEGERKGLPLKEVLGSEPKEFCDEIIQNSGEYAGWEHFMNLLLEYLQMATLFYFIRFIFISSAPASFGLDYSFMIWLVVWCVGGVVLPDYIGRKFSISKKPYGRYLGWVCRLLALLSFIWLSSSPLARQFLFRANGWLILVVMLLMLAAATASMSRHWARCAQRFPQ